MENAEIILIALLALSEALSLIPSLKSNSILQLAKNVLKRIKDNLPQIKNLLEALKGLKKEEKKEIEQQDKK